VYADGEDDGAATRGRAVGGLALGPHVGRVLPEVPPLAPEDANPVPIRLAVNVRHQL